MYDFNMDNKQSYLIPANQYAVFASVCVCHVQKCNGMMYQIKVCIHSVYVLCFEQNNVSCITRLFLGHACLESHCV